MFVLFAHALAPPRIQANRAIEGDEHSIADEVVRALERLRVTDILSELSEYGLQVQVHDPLADPAEAEAEYGITLKPLAALSDAHAVVLAVPHAAFLHDAGP